MKSSHIIPLVFIFVMITAGIVMSVIIFIKIIKIMLLGFVLGFITCGALWLYHVLKKRIK